MDRAYILWHVTTVGEEEDEKLIGVFATKADADAAILKVRDKSGFKDYPDGFLIDEYTVNRIHWEEGFVYAKF